MNGEVEISRTEAVIFPVKTQEREVSEGNSIKIEETIVTEIRTIETQNRFARLKRTLRKRSRSIL